MASTAVAAVGRQLVRIVHALMMVVLSQKKGKEVVKGFRIAVRIEFCV